MGGVRWIDVNLTSQVLTAYQGDTAVHSVIVSTGRSQTPTPVGQFRIYVKFVTDDMQGADYFLPAVPWVMYFQGGYGIHGTYWHDNFGEQMSHGCVNLPPSEAEWLFHWSDVGTLVNIHY
jgi:lipoprotein-anchoring transpeptidase ErfK/SrfK